MIRINQIICEEGQQMYILYLYLITHISSMDIQEANIPKQWLCPITQQLMKHPVLASDGFTYQKKSIQQWFKKSNKSPLTGLALANLTLIPNHALRQTIQKYGQKLALNPLAPPVVPPAPPSSVSYQLPNLTLSFDSKRSQDSNSNTDNFYLKCQIVPPENPVSSRNSCSIICILDVSESMDTDSVAGGKDMESHGFSRLDLVKHSINTMVEFMGDGDQIALVPFSTSAKIALPTTKTTKAGKALIRQKTKNMQTIGTTNIWDGFKVSIELLKQLYKRKNHNIFMVLLTDGQPNLNPPRGIVPTLIKFLDIQKLPRPNIHVFGYGYELDTNMLTQIAEVGHGTYTYIPDCSMVGTAFVNFMASALATITNNLTFKIQEINPNCDKKDIEVIGFKRTQKDIYNIGSIQYGQSRQIMIRVPVRSVKQFKDNYKFSNIQIVYGQQQKSITSELFLKQHPQNQIQIQKSILKSKYLTLLQKLCKQKKSTIKSAFDQIDQFFLFVKKIHQHSPSPLTKSLLAELKNPSNENQGQVSKSFEKQQWYQKWGHHYIPSLFRAHVLQTCTNFKDPALQLYTPLLFQQNQSNMDTIFIKMAPPQPSAKKVEKFVYKPAPVDMSDYYDYNGGCIYGKCKVMMADGTTKQMENLVKGDQLPNGVVKCIVKTNVYAWIQMIKIGELIITAWHPIKVDNNWIFPCYHPKAQKISIFIQSFYNFVLTSSSLICQQIQCIGLGHGINDNPVTRHEYFQKKIIQDLEQFQGWQKGQVILRGFRREQKIIKDGQSSEQRVIGIL